VRGLLGPVAVAVAVQVHVSGVKNAEGASGRGHDPQHVTFLVGAVD
jgi:hypothetical protein